MKVTCAEHQAGAEVGDRRYSWTMANGQMASRKLTAYECQLEDDVQQLQDALFTISSHYAKIQFRLRQIATASGHKRECLLREMERMMCQDIDERRLQAELPDLCLGNARAKQHQIIGQLRHRLRNLLEVPGSCYGASSESNFSPLEKRRQLQPPDEEQEQEHGEHCSCVGDQKRFGESNRESDFSPLQAAASKSDPTRDKENSLKAAAPNRTKLEAQHASNSSGLGYRLRRSRARISLETQSRQENRKRQSSPSRSIDSKSTRKKELFQITSHRCPSDRENRKRRSKRSETSTIQPRLKRRSRTKPGAKDSLISLKDSKYKLQTSKDTHTRTSQKELMDNGNPSTTRSCRDQSKPCEIKKEKMKKARNVLRLYDKEKFINYPLNRSGKGRQWNKEREVSNEREEEEEKQPNGKDTPIKTKAKQKDKDDSFLDRKKRHKDKRKTNKTRNREEDKYQSNYDDRHKHKDKHKDNDNFKAMDSWSDNQRSPLVPSQAVTSKCTNIEHPNIRKMAETESHHPVQPFDRDTQVLAKDNNLKSRLCMFFERKLPKDSSVGHRNHRK